MPNITIEDIRNPQRASGFDHVIVDHGGSIRAASPYRAENGYRGSRAAGTARGWRGPRRKTAEESAQDYCDYINGSFIQPSFTLKSAGHPTKPRKLRKRKDGHVVAPPRKKEGPGYVYLMGEEDDPNLTLVKIGESKSEPKYRPAGLQTGNGRKLVVLGYLKTDKRLELETKLHRKYLKRNKMQEWFWSTRAIFGEFGVTVPTGYKQPTMKEVPTWTVL